jgi:hypothetical protein
MLDHPNNARTPIPRRRDPKVTPLSVRFGEDSAITPFKETDRRNRDDSYPYSPRN